MLIKTVICDDDLNSSSIISEYINRINNPHIKLIGIIKCGHDLIEFCKENKPDLILLDMNMPLINGIDAAKKIQEFLPNISTIIITGYPEYSLKAFEIHAIDYLVKPISIDQLEKSLNYIINKLTSNPANNNLLTISNKNNIYTIRQNELLFAEKIGKKVVIHTNNQTIETYDSLKNLQKKLNKNLFIRTHNSYIVNKNAISQIEKFGNGIGKIHLKNYDKPAFISRRNKAKFDVL